jgi:hypothetical protein
VGLLAPDPCASVFFVRSKSVSPRARRAIRILFFLLFFLALAILPLPFVAFTSQRIHLDPKFVAGQTLRYRIESRTTTTGETTTPILNPEGVTKSTETVRVVIRLDVLAAHPIYANAENSVRLRATYETSHADVETDGFDPTSSALEDAYTRIEGRSIEYTLGPDGHPVSLQGIDAIYPDPAKAAPVLAWLDALPVLANLPRNGIGLGEKWSAEHPFPNAALTGLIWRDESTYLQDEPCGPFSDRASARNTANDPREPGTADDAQAPSPSAPAPSPSAPGSPPVEDTCAQILTKFEISRHGSDHSDATPPDYLKNGLRTFGSWTGSGQNLASVSRTTGFIVNSTQTSTQDMDYTIKSAASGSAIHRKSHVEDQSEITLVAP